MNPDVSLQVIARQLVIMNKLKLHAMQWEGKSYRTFQSQNEAAEIIIKLEEQISEDEKRVRD